MITIALTVIVSVFAITGVSYAQSVNAVPSGGNDAISITARIVGCGDGVAQVSLGEQCDGIDLNNQSCSTLGFNAGVLSCRNSCIFETSACINNSGNSGSGSGGGSVRGPRNVFEYTVPTTNVVFTGIGEPDSTFFVTTSDGYFISVPIDNNGNFSVTVSEPNPGYYNFTFYTLSSNGLFGSRDFSTDIAQYATTYIDNIFIPYEISEIIDLEISVIEENPELEIIPDLDNKDLINGDLYAEFLGVLSQNENLSPDELRELIKVFSEKNGYIADVPGYSPDGLRIGLLPYINRQWMKIPEVARKWYPNVYISFLGPYRIFFYEVTDWYHEINNPLLRWLLE